MITEYTDNEMAAYHEGWRAWKLKLVTTRRVGNPYKRETDLWRAWNKGWNSNHEGVFDDEEE